MDTLTDKEYLKAFGQRLKALRTARHLTLQELSAKCNIDTARLSRMESGLVNVKVISIRKLAECLEVTIPQLMDYIPVK